MKTAIFIFTVVLSAMCMAADPVTTSSLTVDGKVLKHVSITASSPDEVRIVHDDGILIVKYEAVPKEIAEKVGISAEKATAYREDQAKKFADKQAREVEAKRVAQEKEIADHEASIKAKAAHDAQVAAAAELAAKEKHENDLKEAARLIKQKTTTIRTVETNLRGWEGEDFIINGLIDVSSYYNFHFRNADDRYFSFKIEDKTGTAYVYMLRNDAQELRKQILDNGKPLKGSFTIMLPDLSNRPSERPIGVMGILIAASPPLEEIKTNIPAKEVSTLPSKN